MKRALVRAIALAVLALAAGSPHGQDRPGSAAPATPKVFALVAAVGSTFNIAVQRKSTGSHLNAYRRIAIDDPGDTLNRVVLNSLDKEIALIQPDSQRVYFALSAAQMAGVPPSEREAVAMAKVLAELEKMPQRAQWERIVVATPAYKAFEVNGVADRLQGMGISMHPLTGELSAFFNVPFDLDKLRGEDVITPDGRTGRTAIYLAPYSYLAIWVLDPKTLAVLDKQERFDNRKVADPRSDSLDLGQSVGKDFLARQVVGVIERSIHEAVTRTELAGQVDVREVREVKPESGNP